MKSLLVAAVLAFALGFVACSSGGTEALCDHVQECAEKRGESFSVTSCKSDLVEAEERAETAGCGDEYTDYTDCVGGVSFECSDDLEDVFAAECGSKAKAVNECLGDSPSSPAASTNECERATERVYAKIRRCDGAVKQATENDGEGVECTDESGRSANRSATTIESMSCDEIRRIFPKE